ncbi:MAG: immune inhibitor A, partial [Candidatus Marinimicrobia bacterium]|nr:immune inhibitor A [Candidatus Neomarinimicrobiota bacterium]
MKDKPMKIGNIRLFALYLILIANCFAATDGTTNNRTAGKFIAPDGTEFKLGCIWENSPPEWVIPSPAINLDRDYRSSIDLSADFPPIRSQGSQGSCVAWAAGYYYKAYQEWQEHNWDLGSEDHQFSPAFIYNQINGGQDEGSQPSDAFKLLIDNGCATWSEMPYNQYQFTNLPSEETYESALNYRSEEVYSLDLNTQLLDLKNHLLNGNIAVIAISIYDHFYNISSHNYTYCVSTMIGERLGGHAITICGFDDNQVTEDGLGAFKIANSWGIGWGENGYFYMSYEAVQNSMLCSGIAYYTSDKIDYEPLVLARIHVDHDIRNKVGFRFGIGDNGNSNWSKKLFDWSLSSNIAIAFPNTNIVVDLTDGVTDLSLNDSSNIFIECKDGRFQWHTSSEHAYQGNSWWCADESIPGYGNGWLMYYETPEIALGDSVNELSFMLSYAVEDPAQYGDYDGWDGANVRISTDGFSTWEILNGQPAYDFLNGWAWAYNGETDSLPGWGGYHPQWQTASFDLADYAGQTVGLRIMFGSDGAWSSVDDINYFGLVIDDITVTGAGNTLFFDDGETGSRSLPGIIDYFSVEHLGWGVSTISDETPATIPEDYGVAVVNASLAPPAPYTGPDWYVSNYGDDITGNGSMAAPFSTIQNAVNLAADFDTILCYPGEYQENIVIDENNITLGSFFINIPDTNFILNTVITPTEDRAITINSCSTTISLIGLKFSSSFGGDDGGIKIDTSTVFINHCYFINNNNYRGGAIYAVYSTLKVYNSIFIGNRAQYGGAISTFHTNLSSVSNIFEANHAVDYGGAILCHIIDTCLVENSRFISNYADSLSGGAIHLNGEYARISNSLFAYNSCQFLAGAVLAQTTSMEITGSTFYGNSSPHNGGGYYSWWEDSTVITNTIFWDNSPNQLCLNGWDYGTNVSISHSVIMDSLAGIFAVGDSQLNWGVGNQASDPLFCDTDNNEFTLASNSPCLGTGENELNIGAYGAGCGPILGIDNSAPNLPAMLTLYGNFPNPFNPKTNIKYAIPATGYVTINVYNIMGQRIKTLIAGNEQAGIKSV